MEVMIDWVTAEIRWDSHMGYETGLNLQIDRHGEVVEQWAGRALIVEPSWSSVMSVRSADHCSLELSGNPAKFLTGHNLYGSGRLSQTYWPAGEKVRLLVGLFPSPQTYSGRLSQRFSRLDITRSARVPEGTTAADWVNWYAAGTRTRHKRKQERYGSSLYLGVGSRYWRLKVYDKQAEVKHQFEKRIKDLGDFSLAELEHWREQIAWCEGIVRFEVTISGREIKRLMGTRLYEKNIGGMEYGGDLPEGFVEQVWRSKMDSVSMADNAVSGRNLDKLNAREMVLVRLWALGGDPFERMTQPTKYRIRKAVRDKVGLDLFGSPAEVESGGGLLEDLQWDPEPSQQLGFVLN